MIALRAGGWFRSNPSLGGASNDVESAALIVIAGIDQLEATSKLVGETSPEITRARSQPGIEKRALGHLPFIAIVAFSFAIGVYYGTLIGVFSWIGSPINQSRIGA